jgi:NDP-sugar pyrophosphorylase family protein
MPTREIITVAARYPNFDTHIATLRENFGRYYFIVSLVVVGGGVVVGRALVVGGGVVVGRALVVGGGVVVGRALVVGGGVVLGGVVAGGGVVLGGVVAGDGVVAADFVVAGGAVVVVAGDAAACAGTITDLTTGLTHLTGTPSAPNVLPANAIRKIRRRSKVIARPPSCPQASA